MTGAYYRDEAWEGKNYQPKAHNSRFKFSFLIFALKNVFENYFSP